MYVPGGMSVAPCSVTANFRYCELALCESFICCNPQAPVKSASLIAMRTACPPVAADSSYEYASRTVGMLPITLPVAVPLPGGYAKSAAPPIARSSATARSSLDDDGEPHPAATTTNSATQLRIARSYHGPATT